jgi:hypothetical protein
MISTKPDHKKTNSKESIDAKTLQCLLFIGDITTKITNDDSGIKFLDFVKHGLNVEAITLIDKGYVMKVKVFGENSEGGNYKLTDKGIEYYKNIIQYANELDRTH